MNLLFPAALCCAALALPAAHAAEPKPGSTAAAASPSARVPVPAYDSAFSGYQPFREQKLAPWRELNEAVHEAGGHIGIVGGAAGKPAAPHSPGHKK